MLADVLRLSLVQKPAPIVLDGAERIESRFPEHALCTACVGRDCFSVEKPGLDICDRRLSYCVGYVDGHRITAYGMLAGAESPARRDKRLLATLKGRNLSLSAFNEWIDQIRGLVELFSSARKDGAGEMLESLHDVKKRAAKVYECTEKLVLKDPVRSLRENLDQADFNLRDAFSSARMMRNSLQLLTVFYNPDAASFGNKRSRPIYKLIERLAHMANGGHGLSQRPVVRLEGTSRSEAMVYDSFEMLPNALIENAVKYAMHGGVSVCFSETLRVILVEVRSTGPLIEAGEMDRIFEKGVRGRFAPNVAPGSGLGLYAAKVVAECHGTRIDVESKPLGYSKNNIPQAENCFRFALNRSGN